MFKQRIEVLYMDTVSMSSLLQAEEDKLRTELQADSVID